MSETRSPKRPWLAALLALVVTGAGHAYLRRWGRAFAWFALVYAAVWLLVPEEAVVAVSKGMTLKSPTLPPSVNPLLFLPPFLVALASVVDAYMLARAEREAAIQAKAADGLVTCPNCGREADDDLGFCPWCTTRFADPEDEDDAETSDDSTDEAHCDGPMDEDDTERGRAE